MKHGVQTRIGLERGETGEPERMFDRETLTSGDEETVALGLVGDRCAPVVGGLEYVGDDPVYRSRAE